MNTLKVQKLRNDAIMPTKGTPNSVGYDITIIDAGDYLTENTRLFRTGLRVLPPEGYYIEILPRSSLSKTGYILANSVGIIDPDYRGELLIALTALKGNFDIRFPFNKFQMVLRKYENYVIEEVNEMNETQRGSGGFGSTG